MQSKYRAGVNRWRSRSGWYGHAYEHYLARRGIKTATRRPGLVASLGTIRITAANLPGTMVYPVTPEEVKAILSDMPEQDLKGLKAVEFVPPKDAQQRDAYAQYVRSRHTMLIFAQERSADGKVAGKDPKEVREHMKRYVVPHELGHHAALKRLGTDSRLSLAEARADGYAFGMDPADRDVKVFEKYHKV